MSSSSGARKILDLFDNLYYIPARDELMLGSTPPSDAVEPSDAGGASSSSLKASAPPSCLYSLTLEKRLGGARSWIGLVCNEVKLQQGNKDRDEIQPKEKGKLQTMGHPDVCGAAKERLLMKLQTSPEGSVLRLSPRAFKQTLASRPIILGDEGEDAFSFATDDEEVKQAFERELRRRGIARDSDTGRKLRALHRQHQEEAREMRMVRMAVLTARAPRPTSKSKDLSPFDLEDDSDEEEQSPVELMPDGQARVEAFKGMIRARLAACFE